MFSETILADRTKQIAASGIRKIFELAKTLKDPIDLSIGQPHFDVPAPVKNAAKSAIDAGKNGYTITQGIPELRERLKAELETRYAGQERDVVVTSGTSGGLLLALLAVVNPGDEVIIPDPYFVSYPTIISMAGGRAVTFNTYPDFRLDPEKIAAAITPRTKAILFSTPANPTGAATEPTTLRAIAELAQRRGVLVISDEIYRAFHYDGPPVSPAAFSPDVLAIEGFGKTYGMTGWRLGWRTVPSAWSRRWRSFSSSRSCALRAWCSGPDSPRWIMTFPPSSPTTGRSATWSRAVCADTTNSPGPRARSTCSRGRRGARAPSS